MAAFNDAWAEHQRKRWMRPDAERYLRPDWRSRKYWVTPPDENGAVISWSGKSADIGEESNVRAADLRAAQARLAHLRWLVADLKFDLVMRDLALRRLARKANFNPNQPRVPAGDPDGGQWTDADGGGPGTKPATSRRINDPRVISDVTPGHTWKPGVQYAQNETPKNPVLNRHILEGHVGKSDHDLVQRIRREQLPGLFVTAGRDRIGSFDSAESAEDFVRRTIENNPETVAHVAGGHSGTELLTWRFGYETGREALLDPNTGGVRIRKTYEVGVVIRHDPTSSTGYRVITAYPRNYNPRIGR